MKLLFIRFITFTLCIIAMIAGALFLEVLLDLTGLESTKHVIGTTGSILILISIGYSLRKRKCIFKQGQLKRWLAAHEWLAIVGTGLIFIHGGFHGHALVPLITTGVMFVAAISGLTGRYLYLKVSSELTSWKKELEEKGLAREEIENTISSLIIAHRVMKHWRTVHIPIVFVLAVVVTFHVSSALYFDGVWK
ncbi:MAG: hypothetical protein U0586_08025 [Candidatus Brocadiaceae bacterium]